jgi:hypothetical protein
MDSFLQMLLGINPAMAGALGPTPPLGGAQINQPIDMPDISGRPVGLPVQAGASEPAPPMQTPSIPAQSGAGVASREYPSLGASLAGSPYQNPASTAGSVAANIPTAASSTSLPGMPGVGGQRGTGQSSILDALRGVKAPAPPQVQTVRTPPPPVLAPIKGGELINMMTSLGVSPQDLMRLKLGVR